MKIAIAQRSDGGVSYAPVIREQRQDETDVEFRGACIRRLQAEHPSAAILMVDETALPVNWRDRRWRNAWTWDGATIAIDMMKARDIHRDWLRHLRKPLLEALDVAMSRAYKDPMLQDQIEAKRQALRDVTADIAIESALTIEELVVPDILKV